MTLARFSASAEPGRIELHCLELAHSAWPAPVRLVEDQQDWTVTLEGALGPATFLGANNDSGHCWSSTHPSVDGTGRATRTFEVEDVGGEIDDLLESVRGSAEPVLCIKRTYLSDNLVVLASGPERLWVSGVIPGEGKLQFTATSRDVSNRTLQQLRHTPENSPGLRGR